jgi:hypothetical protein
MARDRRDLHNDFRRTQRDQDHDRDRDRYHVGYRRDRD